jgi:hypothetical protein
MKQDVLDLQLKDDAFPSVRHFARRMLKGNFLALAPLRDRIWTSPGHVDVGDQKVMTCILFRSGCWQVELLMVHPGQVSPLHRHNFCESADVILCGDLTGSIGGRSISQPRGDRLAANIEVLPRGAWHGGGTQRGLVALSFQRWIGREPTFIADDWEAFDGHAS